MLKRLLYILSITLCYYMLSVEPAWAEGRPGLIGIANEVIRCSGVNVVQKGDLVYALTAAHCLASDQPLTITDSVTGRVLGTALPTFIAGDLAVVVYWATEATYVMPYGTARPPFGAVIWACAVAYPDKQGVCYAGLWSGDRYTYEGMTFLIATLPVRQGFSGGPIGYGDRVIGIFSIRMGENITGMTPVGPAILYLEGKR